jgi:hypothetical protein
MRLLAACAPKGAWIVRGDAVHVWFLRESSQNNVKNILINSALTLHSYSWIHLV